MPFDLLLAWVLVPLGLGLLAAACSALVAQLSMQGLILWRMQRDPRIARMDAD